MIQKSLDIPKLTIEPKKNDITRYFIKDQALKGLPNKKLKLVEEKQATYLFEDDIVVTKREFKKNKLKFKRK